MKNVKTSCSITRGAGRTCSTEHTPFNIKISSYKVKIYRDKNGKPFLHYFFSLSCRKCNSKFIEFGGPGLGLFTLIRHRFINPYPSF